MGGLVRTEVKHGHAESIITGRFVKQGVASAVSEKVWEELQSASHLFQVGQSMSPQAPRSQASQLTSYRSEFEPVLV